MHIDSLIQWQWGRGEGVVHDPNSRPISWRCSLPMNRPFVLVLVLELVLDRPTWFSRTRPTTRTIGVMAPPHVHVLEVFPLRDRGRLIEPFVFGLERRHGDVDDSELADGAVPAARLDVNGRHRFDREELSVQFHLPFAFEY